MRIARMLSFAVLAQVHPMYILYILIYLLLKLETTCLLELKCMLEAHTKHLDHVLPIAFVIHGCNLEAWVYLSSFDIKLGSIYTGMFSASVNSSNIWSKVQTNLHLSKCATKPHTYRHSQGSKHFRILLTFVPHRPVQVQILSMIYRKVAFPRRSTPAFVELSMKLVCVWSRCRMILCWYFQYSLGAASAPS